MAIAIDSGAEFSQAGEKEVGASEVGGGSALFYALGAKKPNAYPVIGGSLGTLIPSERRLTETRSRTRQWFDPPVLQVKSD